MPLTFENLGKVQMQRRRMTHLNSWFLKNLIVTIFVFALKCVQALLGSTLFAHKKGMRLHALRDLHLVLRC